MIQRWFNNPPITFMSCEQIQGSVILFWRKYQFFKIENCNYLWL